MRIAAVCVPAWRFGRAMLTKRGSRPALGLLVALLASVAAPALGQQTVPVQVLDATGAPSDNFGGKVAIDGDTMVVGSRNDDYGGNINQGSAHVYRWTGSSWAYEATLLSSDGATSDQFGISVAIQGNTIVVGASLDDVGAVANQGSAYVFVRSGTTWTQQAKLIAADGVGSDTYGASVAIDNDTVVVTSPGDDIGAVANQGSAYVFVRVGAAWTQQAKITASGGASGDFFGSSVAIDGETIVVGTTLDDVGANSNQGSATVFVRSGSAWTQQASLVASDGAATDGFGSSVDIDGDSIIVGAMDDNVGANANQGSACVFTRAGSTWTQQAQLVDPQGTVSNRFGSGVAIDGDSVVVGGNGYPVGANANQGSVVAFARFGTSWTQQARLYAPDGGANDYFGIAVAISGDSLVVGAEGDTVAGMAGRGSAWAFSRTGGVWIKPRSTVAPAAPLTSRHFGSTIAMTEDVAVVGAYTATVGGLPSRGAAYVLARNGPTWSDQAQLIADDGVNSAQFGRAVAVSGDTVVVAAPNQTVNGVTFVGAVYVYVRSGTTWTLEAEIMPPDGESGMAFGDGVAISGDLLAIGAPGADMYGHVNQGAVYIFNRSGTTWTQQIKLSPNAGDAGEQFGSSVAISGTVVVAGAVGYDSNRGAAYVYTRYTATQWTSGAMLLAPDGQASDRFGDAVAISGNTVLVGAALHDHDGRTNSGAAYVYAGSLLAWTFQGELTSFQLADEEYFGGAVAIDGNVALVGADATSFGPTVAGSAYIFERRGTAWSAKGRLTDPVPTPDSGFGSAVALNGRTAMIGAEALDVGGLNQGQVTIASVEPGDLSLARNINSGAYATSIDAAAAAAQAGDSLVATAACFRDNPTVSITGRQLHVTVEEPIRTTPESTVTLGSGSSLRTLGREINLFGALDVPASQWGTLVCDALRIGSRGSLHVYSNAQLLVDAPKTQFDGVASIDTRGDLSLRGELRNCGAVTSELYSDVSSTGAIANSGAWTVTSGSIAAPSFTNRDAFDVLGTSGIFGDFMNDAGATTTITSGRLFIVGTLTNNGTIVGAACNNCLGTAPNLNVDGDVHLGSAASVSLAFGDSVLNVSGDFDCAINSSERFDLSLATLQLEGIGAEQSLEVMSTDIGPDALGLDRSQAGHYPIGTLEIGPAISTVRLVDAHDNDGLGQASCEAVYVDQLVVHAGSRLINPSCKIYYNTLTLDGTADNPDNLIPIAGGACVADFDQDGGVTGGDIGAFFTAFEEGLPEADVDQDGGITGGDIGVFFQHFEAGC